MKTTKMKPIALLGIVSLLLISILLSLTFVSNNISAFAMENEQNAEKTSLTKLSETGDFYTDKVIIVLSEEETQNSVHIRRKIFLR